MFVLVDDLSRFNETMVSIEPKFCHFHFSNRIVMYALTWEVIFLDLTNHRHAHIYSFLHITLSLLRFCTITEMPASDIPFAN